MDKAKKQAIMAEYGRDGKDVGSPDVQVAVLTARISEITEHLRTHRKDHSSRRGLIGMVNRRRKLLEYVSRKDHTRYLELIGKLELRH